MVFKKFQLSVSKLAVPSELFLLNLSFLLHKVFTEQRINKFALRKITMTKLSAHCYLKQISPGSHDSTKPFYRIKIE